MEGERTCRAKIEKFYRHFDPGEIKYCLMKIKTERQLLVFSAIIRLIFIKKFFLFILPAFLINDPIVFREARPPGP
jgi:hypothetical protein